MRLPDIISAVALLAAGVAGGLLLGGPVAIVGGIVIGSALAAGALTLGIRPLVAISVAVGGVAGLFVGTSVIRVLCLPDTCKGLEAFGGSVTAAGAIVGVGIVVALATRSFDEYHEAVQAGRPPPEPGCETDQDGYA
jgi:hypothetical protein